MRRPFEIVLAVCAGLVLAFLVLPILALFLRIPPEDLLSQLEQITGQIRGAHRFS